MRMQFVALALLSFRPELAPAQSAAALPQRDRAKAAIERTLPLLQRSAQTWIEKQTCSSCHHQGLGTLAVLAARDRGIAIDQRLLDAQIEHMTFVRRETALMDDAGVNPQIGQPYLLLTGAVAGKPVRREVGEARAHLLAGLQGVDGRWRSESHRPPLEDSDFTATALCIRALQVFGAPTRQPEYAGRVARAREWLESAQTRSTEERVMQLLGLTWAGASRTRISALSAALARDQQPDGGWAQIPGRSSDAYATGAVLFTLQQIGALRAGDQVFRNGIEFLLKTQRPDGSWHQSTRRRGPGLPYFETGFPHGEDQFISYAGTAWATIALALAIDPRPTALMSIPDVRTAQRSVKAQAMSDGVTPLMEAAVSGTQADLERLLASGADVNARSGAGLTALMCAVHDARMTSLLLDRGADVNARTDSGATPLYLAAAYSGAIESMKTLLDRGAAASTVTKKGATPLHAAVETGDVAKVTLLLARGADVNAALTQAGFTPLHYAAFIDHADVARTLLKGGAKPDARIPAFGNTTAVIEAALAGNAKVLEVLIAAGADVDAKDDEGRTALMYAVWRDPGYADAAELLLRAGADVKSRMPDGTTALALAEQSTNARFATLLRAAGASR
jgi:ankyrin repeat protein